jgi:methyl-accepting chemotaxis protein
MSWLDNIKIGKKLVGGFLLVAIIAGVIGWIGYTRIHEVDDRDTMLFEQVVVPLGELAHIDNYFQRVRVNTREVVRANEADKIQYFIERIQGFSEEINKLSESYEKTLFTDHGKKLFNDFVESRKVSDLLT